MVIRKALEEDAAVAGEVHSKAWKQTYQGIFDQEYIDKDSPELRSKEFLDSLETGNIFYYILEEDSQAAGIVKLSVEDSEVEILSIYILEEFRGLGGGRLAIEHIRSAYRGSRIILRVLVVNAKARAFYEKCGFVLTDQVRTISRGGEFRQLMYICEGE